MKVKIEINCDNAAFHWGNGEVRSRNSIATGDELARILQELANKIKNQEISVGDSYSLRDINGNRVGEMKVMRS